MSHTNNELREKFRVYLGSLGFSKEDCDLISKWWLKEIAGREERLVEEIEKLKINMEARHKELCGPGGCSKTNRRLNMQFDRGQNKGIERVITLITNQDTKSHE